MISISEWLFHKKFTFKKERRKPKKQYQVAVTVITMFLKVWTKNANTNTLKENQIKGERQLIDSLKQ